MHDKNKDPKKLNAEELEKRVAPLALTYSDPTQDPPPPPPDPIEIIGPPDTGTPSGGGGTSRGGGRTQE